MEEEGGHDNMYTSSADISVGITVMGLRGIITSIGSPFIVGKTLLQSQRRPLYTPSVATTPSFVNGFMAALSRSTAQHGTLGWWRGNTVSLIENSALPLAEELVSTTLEIAGLWQTEGAIMDHEQPFLPISLHVSTYAIAGLIISPLAFLRTRMVVYGGGGSSGIIGTIRLIYKTEGAKAFTKGAMAYALMSGSKALLPILGDFILLQWVGMDVDMNDTPGFLGCQMLWYGLELLILLPLETACQRLRTDRTIIFSSSEEIPAPLVPINNPAIPYDGVTDCISRILAEEGFGQLYSGIGWHIGYRAALLLLHACIG